MNLITNKPYKNIGLQPVRLKPEIAPTPDYTFSLYQKNSPTSWPLTLHPPEPSSRSNYTRTCNGWPLNICALFPGTCMTRK